jgi:hypothetical protein
LAIAGMWSKLKPGFIRIVNCGPSEALNAKKLGTTLAIP